MDKTIENILIGFASGLSVALGGAIKDAPYEGFNPVTFMRSPVVGAIEAPIISYAFKGKVHPVLLFLSTIATERLTVELYKILRAKVPGKFVVGEWGVPKGNNGIDI